jgi:Spy/CpxP family protein refolding chaperone
MGSSSHPWRVCAVVIAMVAAMLLLSVIPAAAERPGPGFHANLNLTPDQRDKLRKHMGDTGAKVAAIRSDMRDARMDMYRQLQNYQVDQRRLQESIRRINALQIKMLNAHLESQMRLRDILTKDQFQSLTQAIGGRGASRDGSGFFFGDQGMGGDVKRLGLSPDQQEKIKKLWDASRSTMSALRDKLKFDSRNLEKLYLDYDLDPKVAKQRIDKLGDTELQVLKATVARQLQLRNILTEDQFQELAKTMRPPFEGHKGPDADRRPWKNKR